MHPNESHKKVGQQSAGSEVKKTKIIDFRAHLESFVMDVVSETFGLFANSSDTARGDFHNVNSLMGIINETTKLLRTLPGARNLCAHPKTHTQFTLEKTTGFLS